MKKWLLILILLLIGSNCTFATNLEDVFKPKDPANRFGIGNELEEVFSVVNSQSITLKNAKVENVSKKTYSSSSRELDLKKMSKEIINELDLEAEDILSDINILWTGAAMKSETIKFAMYKLSNPDEDKPKQSIVKKIIQPIASMTTIAGMGTGNPLIAGSALIGSSLFNNLTVDDKELNYKYSKVSDADMVILIRKIDDLQRSLVNYYSDYMSAKKQLEIVSDILQRRTEICQIKTLQNHEQELIADAYYRKAQDMQKKARAEFLYKRASLEQLVGHDTLLEFEASLNNNRGKTE